MTKELASMEKGRTIALKKLYNLGNIQGTLKVL
jgi:hypothetical protein